LDTIVQQGEAMRQALLVLRNSSLDECVRHGDPQVRGHGRLLEPAVYNEDV